MNAKNFWQNLESSCADSKDRLLNRIKANSATSVDLIAELISLRREIRFHASYFKSMCFAVDKYRVSGPEYMRDMCIKQACFALLQTYFLSVKYVPLDMRMLKHQAKTAEMALELTDISADAAKSLRKAIRQGAQRLVYMTELAKELAEFGDILLSTKKSSEE